MTHPMEEAVKLSIYLFVQAAKGQSPFNVVEATEGAGTVLWDKIWKPLG